MDFTLTITGPEDELGRRQFVLDWERQGRKRGQFFHAVPADIARAIERAGGKVTIVRPYGTEQPDAGMLDSSARLA